MKAIVSVAALFVIVAACSGGSNTITVAPPTEDAAPTAAAPAPEDLPLAEDFELATFGGDTFRLSDHFGQLPVVLNFWAPW